jgi:hypothetical protein
MTGAARPTCDADPQALAHLRHERTVFRHNLHRHAGNLFPQATIFIVKNLQHYPLQLSLFAR